MADTDLVELPLTAASRKPVLESITLSIGEAGVTVDGFHRIELVSGDLDSPVTLERVPFGFTPDELAVYPGFDECFKILSLLAAFGLSKSRPVLTKEKKV